MFLELAENNNQGYYSMMAQGGEDASESYMYIPAQFSSTGEGMYVREDSFDMLPEHQWDELQDVLEPYQERNLSLFGLGKKGRARRKARKAARQTRKVERMGIRAGTKKIRAETGGGALGIIGETVSNIFGGGQAGMPAMDIAPTELPPPAPRKLGFLGMPNWVIPVVAVGGIVTVLAMTGRKRKGK